MLPCAFALNSSLDINQYAHNAWTVRDGFFKGAINAIAQTPDGYLWLGTEFGLVRFDGVRSVPWSPPPGEHLPSNNILKLLVTRDGRLWIGTATGLAGWKDGKLTHYPELAGQTIISVFEDRQGVTWSGSLGAPTGRLCAIKSAGAQCYGTDGSLGLGVLSLYEYRPYGTGDPARDPRTILALCNADQAVVDPILWRKRFATPATGGRED